MAGLISCIMFFCAAFGRRWHAGDISADAGVLCGYLAAIWIVLLGIYCKGADR